MTTAFAPPAGRRPSIEWVPIADLLIDDSYQRSLDTTASKRLVRAIATSWDWDVLDVLKVSRRPDDRLFVIDGQHRRAAAALRADIDSLPCVLKRCAGPAEEARLFIAANRGRKAMSRLDDFRAAVGAGDSEAVEVEQLVRAAGLSIARTERDVGVGEIAIVSPLRTAHRYRGAEVTGRALAVLGTAFGGEVIASASALFGAALAILAFTDWTDEQLLVVLQVGTSQDWLEWAEVPSGLGGQSKVIAMRAAIEKRLTAVARPNDPTASLPACQPASLPACQLAAASVRAASRNNSQPCGPAPGSSTSSRSDAPTPTRRSAASPAGCSDVNNHFTPRERDVLDRWDAGEGSVAIAAALGRRESEVQAVIATYCGGDGSPAHERTRLLSLRDACAAHAAAVAATGRNYA